MKNEKRDSANPESEENKEYLCGLGSCRPKWTASFAKPKVFLVNYVILSILQGSFRSYMVGTMTTLERRFAFESKISGFILLADNISQIIVSPLLGYMGTRCNRPRLLGIGTMIVAVGLLGTALPYFIYGPALHLLMDQNGSNSTNFDFCDASGPEKCDETKGTIMGAVIIFWMANFINGIGSTAFYVLGVPHVDDSFKKKNSAIYLSTLSS